MRDFYMQRAAKTPMMLMAVIEAMGAMGLESSG